MLVATTSVKSDPPFMPIPAVHRFLTTLAGLLLLAGCGGGGGGAGSQPPVVAPDSPLAGQIAIEAGSRVDQDTMDELSRFGSQPASDSQVLPVNFILAGYVSGASGSYGGVNGQNFSFRADPEDIFSVPMAEGEVLRLVSLGSRAGDPQLRLTLADGSGTNYADTDPVNGVAEVILGAGMPEQNYRVEVTASGSVPARYVLVKAVSAQLGSFSLDWPNYEFSTEEAIVTLAPQAQGSAVALSAQTAVAARQLGDSDWLMRMPARATPSSAQPRSASDETLDWITELRKTPGVVSAVPNYRFTSTASPVNEKLYPLQWHYDLINGPVAWQLAPDGGVGVEVAVLDSGLFSPSGTSAWHPDLNANVGGGFDFVDNDNYPEDPGSSVGSSVFHGTHVAGTVGAVVQGTSNSTGQGIGGVAFNSTIVPVRVLGEGGTGSSDDLIAAVRWVTGQSGGGKKADVVNLSLGGLPRIQQLEDAIAFGVQQGMIFVGAAGNSATSQQSFPAASAKVLAVSAVDAAGRLASYSNFGSWIDLAAPGGDASRDGNNDGRADVVWSTGAVEGPNGFEASYTPLQGTSMAAPHVAGVMALLKQQKSDRDYSAIRGLLEAGELTNYSGSRSDQLGFGILDASKALQASGNVTVLSPSPSQVLLGNETSLEQTVALNQIGDGQVDITSISAAPSWFTVTRNDLSDGTIALDVALVEPALEENVSYRDTVRVEYKTAQDVTRSLDIPVIAQVLSDEFARTAGTHFVLLVSTTPNEDGFFEAESQLAVDPENGSYSFRFKRDDGVEPKSLDEVAPGSYYLVAGSDIDGDGIICQPGEACAEYPVSGLREVITIEAGQELQNVSMTTSFTRPTISASSPDVLPRPGFQGYRLIESTSNNAAESGGGKLSQ